MIRRIIDKVFGRKPRAAAGSSAKILALAAHGIRRDQLDDCALKTCETLSQAGFKGYMVGGAVRDLLLGKTPKDFDVATDATPEQVRRLFRRSRIIGRRFQATVARCGRWASRPDVRPIAPSGHVRATVRASAAGGDGFHLAAGLAVCPDRNPRVLGVSERGPGGNANP